jgi:hypothetical protein
MESELKSVKSEAEDGQVPHASTSEEVESLQEGKSIEYRTRMIIKREHVQFAGLVDSLRKVTAGTLSNKLLEVAEMILQSTYKPEPITYDMIRELQERGGIVVNFQILPSSKRFPLMRDRLKDIKGFAERGQEVHKILDAVFSKQLELQLKQGMPPQLSTAQLVKSRSDEPKTKDTAAPEEKVAGSYDFLGGMGVKRPATLTKDEFRKQAARNFANLANFANP